MPVCIGSGGNPPVVWLLIMQCKGVCLNLNLCMALPFKAILNHNGLLHVPI